MIDNDTNTPEADPDAGWGDQPIDPTGQLTIGGIPDDDLDRMIAATARPEEAELRARFCLADCPVCNPSTHEIQFAGMNTDPADLLRAAMDAGLAAAIAAQPTPVAYKSTDGGEPRIDPHGICGGADVIVRRGTAFYDSLIPELMLDNIEIDLGGWNRGDPISLKPPHGHLNQSYERYAAWAHAVVAVLIPAGVAAEASIWVD